jgi:hypothetical protein
MSLNKQVTKRHISKLLKLNSTPASTPAEIEAQINPVLQEGWELVNISAFANNVWAIFIKIG